MLKTNIILNIKPSNFIDFIRKSGGLISLIPDFCSLRFSVNYFVPFQAVCTIWAILCSRVQQVFHHCLLMKQMVCIA